MLMMKMIFIFFLTAWRRVFYQIMISVHGAPIEYSEKCRLAVSWCAGLGDIFSVVIIRGPPRRTYMYTWKCGDCVINSGTARISRSILNACGAEYRSIALATHIIIKRIYIHVAAGRGEVAQQISYGIRVSENMYTFWLWCVYIVFWPYGAKVFDKNSLGRYLIKNWTL